MLGAILPAGALSKDEVDEAKARVSRLESEIGAANDDLARLRVEAERLATEIFEAENGIREVEAELRSINDRLSDARDRLEMLQRRLNEQAAEQYMNGPASTLSLILDAESFSQLSDRIEFVDAVTQRTTDLATEVQKLRSELEWEQARVLRARERQRSLLAELENDRRKLFDRLAEQEALVDEIAEKKAVAAEEARRLGREYQEQLQARIEEHEHEVLPPESVGGSVSGTNPLLVCPVGEPRGYSDGFGAPRYGGGYHPHGGVDIIAPQGTPIYATFPGTVRDASNGLGGISVIVTGSQGWTYNAHLVSIARLGAVNTGDVIGYVGATGDTSTPHNHFEWHPNVTPGNWPESAYGYSVVGSAINPYPLLTQVC